LPGCYAASLSAHGSPSEQKLANKAGAQSCEARMGSSITQTREGKLYLICGGNEDAFRKAEPILKELAAQIRFVGKAGEAAKVKALVNMVMNIQHSRARRRSWPRRRCRS